MRTIHYLAVGLLLLCSIRCNDDDLLSPQEIFERDKICLTDLRVGQTNRYEFFVGEDFSDADNDAAEYPGDTLIVEIVAADERGYYVKEYLSAASFSRSADLPLVAHPSRTLYYHLYQVEDRIQVRPENDRYLSRLFLLESNQGLPLRIFESPELEVRGWKTNLPAVTGYFEARLEGFTMNAIQFPHHLNVLLDHRSLEPDGGFGTMHWYDPTGGGLVRTGQYSGQTKRGFGWNLVQ